MGFVGIYRGLWGFMGVYRGLWGFGGVGGGGRGPGMGFWWVFEGKMREFEKSGWG